MPAARRTSPLPSRGTMSSPIRRWWIRSAALAAGLHQRGVRAGDVVGLLSYNNIEFLTTIFAANYLGAIVMPLNWRLAAAELRFILDHSRARALVCDEPLIELADEATRGARQTSSACVSLKPDPPGGSGSPIWVPRPLHWRVRTSGVMTSID